MDGGGEGRGGSAMRSILRRIWLGLSGARPVGITAGSDSDLDVAAVLEAGSLLGSEGLGLPTN
eukprot:scaffold140706_cov21-Tisochrysis_lutea.AAC.1